VRFAIRRSQASDIVAQPDLAGQRRVEPGLVGVERADARKILAWSPLSDSQLVAPATRRPLVEKAEPHRNAGGEREVVMLGLPPAAPG